MALLKLRRGRRHGHVASCDVVCARAGWSQRTDRPYGTDWPHWRDGSYWSKRGCGTGRAIGTLRTARTIGTHGTIWVPPDHQDHLDRRDHPGRRDRPGRRVLRTIRCTQPRALNYAYAWKTSVGYDFADVVNTGPNSQAQIQTNSSVCLREQLEDARRARTRALTALTGTCWRRPARASSFRVRGWSITPMSTAIPIPTISTTWFRLTATAMRPRKRERAMSA